ncbi:MAG: hypothetical protein ABW352_13075 [Polyangiales bacterium]
MRSIALLALLPVLAIATGCPDSHDPDPELPTERDAGPDAVVRPLDASTDATLDAALDATIDASADAGCEGPSFPQCQVERSVDVACEGLRCTGATPVCCRHHDGLAASCLPVGGRCEGSPDVTANISERCDDSADCPENTVCADGFNKGLNHNNGARCEPAAKLYCGFWPAPSFNAYQLCRQDCECPSGQRCSTGRCAL